MQKKQQKPKAPKSASQSITLKGRLDVSRSGMGYVIVEGREDDIDIASTPTSGEASGEVDATPLACRFKTASTLRGRADSLSRCRCSCRSLSLSLSLFVSVSSLSFLELLVCRSSSSFFSCIYLTIRIVKNEK